jgi:transcriptional regulator with XRE-family HTH domain
MAESFGDRLRQQRERQQIALVSIAEQTKINVSLLEGLERDDLLRWPAGIFRRAFIRAYAHAIGLDPDSVVREFLELHPDPVEDVATAAAVPPSAGEESAGHGPPTRLRCLLDRAIGSLPRRRLHQSLLIHESTLESATAIDRDSVKAILPLEPNLAAAASPSTGTAIESDPATGPEAAEATSAPEPDLAAAARPPIETAAADSARAAACDSAKTASPPEPDLAAAAHLCTELGRVLETRDVAPLLEGAAKILNAVGLIVWIWDPHGTALRPALAHGYSDDVLAQLPGVRRDADNATATAFRSEQTRIVNGSDLASGAVVVPLMTPGGCGGVLAVELRQGREQSESVRALAMIFAAQLATLVGFAPLAEAVNA